MIIDVSNEQNIYTVVLSGRLDTMTSPDLKKELESVLPAAEKVVFDLTDLEYISSAGLRVVLSTYQAMDDKDGEFVILHPTEMVLKVFKLTQLDDFLTIEA